MGLRVTANDLSPFLLGQAEEMARKEGLSVEFSLQDMRTITFERQFDLIVQLFSSFGYFDSDKDDHDIISNITRLLRPDGWYVLDLLNQHYLRNHFIPYTERKAGALSITEERTLTERHVVKKLTLHEANGHEHSFTESVRLYTPEEAVRLLESGGLNVVRIVGDYNGGAFDASNSPRMMLFARLTHARC
jgi:SAM-dependent methyltransferase